MGTHLQSLKSNLQSHQKMAQLRAKKFNFTTSKINNASTYISSYNDLIKDEDDSETKFIFLKITDEFFVAHGKTAAKLLSMFFRDHQLFYIESKNQEKLLTIELSVLNATFAFRKLLIEKGYHVTLYDYSTLSENFKKNGILAV